MQTWTETQQICWYVQLSAPTYNLTFHSGLHLQDTFQLLLNVNSVSSSSAGRKLLLRSLQAAPAKPLRPSNGATSQAPPRLCNPPRGTREREEISSAAAGWWDPSVPSRRETLLLPWALLRWRGGLSPPGATVKTPSTPSFKLKKERKENRKGSKLCESLMNLSWSRCGNYCLRRCWDEPESPGTNWMMREE